MTQVQTNSERARQIASERAVEALATVELGARCAALQLPAPSADESLVFRYFGGDLHLIPPHFAARWSGGNAFKSEVVSSGDRLLALHYLLCDRPVQPTGELISFRELPGGNFYFGPFSSRTTKLLAARIGGDIERLRKNLSRLDTAPASSAPSADLAVRIHVIGPIFVTLLYHLPDEESPATAELLFDSCIKQTFNTEDVAVLSGRICFTLV